MPEPWIIDHEVTLFAQVRTRRGPADDNGQRWAEREPTGLMLAVCNCGLNTGWITRDQMPAHETLADDEQHAALGRAPSQDHDLTTMRRSITALLRGLAPEHPVTRIWGRREGATAEQGSDGNAWAADSKDIAELVVTALTQTKETGPCPS